MSKVPVRQIDLFDGDTFLQHNAFRTPGAASGQELDQCMPKVAYLSGKYQNIHSGIFPHAEYITEDNVYTLSVYDFVCYDSQRGRGTVVEGRAEKPD